MSQKRDKIERLIKDNKSELLKIDNHYSSRGWEGGDPERYWAGSEINGHGIFYSWRDDDKEYHYLPGFGFKFIIGRSIISPFDRLDYNRIFMSSSGMTSSNPSKKTKLWLHLPDNRLFFDILDAMRARDKFSPFEVKGEQKLLDNLQAPHFLTIVAYVEHDEIHARIENIQTTDIESVIESFINIFTEEVLKFKALKPHYQETDAEGTRLWSDQGLQSKAYYDLRKKLGRNLLGKIETALRKREIKYQTSWGLTAYLAGLKEVAAKYSLLMVGLSLISDLGYKVRNFFKSHEDLRQERLKAQKIEDKQQEEFKQKQKVKIVDCD